MRNFILIAALALGVAACTSTPTTAPVAEVPVAQCDTPFEAFMQAVEGPAGGDAVVYTGESVERWLFYWNNWPPVGEYVFANKIVPVVTNYNEVTAVLFVDNCLTYELTMDEGLAVMLHECTNPANEPACNAALNEALKQARGNNVTF